MPEFIFLNVMTKCQNKVNTVQTFWKLSLKLTEFVLNFVRVLVRASLVCSDKCQK